MKSSAQIILEGNSNDVSVVTLVIWLGCLAVGVLGLLLPYDHSLSPKAAPPPKVEMLNIQLAEETPPLSEPKPQIPLTPLDALIAPNIPQSMAVAQPSPAIAFALPVEGPTHIVELARAAYTQSPATNATVGLAPAPQTLTFGQGEGRQPKPEYPLRAQREGQQGNVTVRFTVGTDGRVVAARAVSPSPWILLNDSAVRTVQERWRFPSGSVRLYEVVIAFKF